MLSLAFFRITKPPAWPGDKKLKLWKEKTSFGKIKDGLATEKTKGGIQNG